MVGKQKGEGEGAADVNRDGGAMTSGEKFAGELEKCATGLGFDSIKVREEREWTGDLTKGL